MRRAISVIFIVLGCVTAPLALAGIWAVEEIGNTDRYVGTVTSLAGERAVQDAVADRVTAATVRPLRDLGVPLSATGDPVRAVVDTAVAGEEFPAVWERVNRVAHRRLSAVLSGEGGNSPAVSEGGVGLDLTPVYESVRQELASGGLAVAARLPDLHPTVELLSPDGLAGARAAYTTLTAVKRVLPILSAILLVAGVLVAGDRAGALIGAGLGVAAGVVVSALVLVVVRNAYLPTLDSRGVRTDAATVVFDALTGFLRAGLRVLFAAGLLAAAAGLLIRRRRFRAGPAGTAT